MKDSTFIYVVSPLLCFVFGFLVYSTVDPLMYHHEVNSIDELFTDVSNVGAMVEPFKHLGHKLYGDRWHPEVVDKLELLHRCHQTFVVPYRDMCPTPLEPLETTCF